jgi:4-aminobutyrate aminotransferase
MAETGSHLSGVWSQATELQIERGAGCRVIDVNGHEYLDFTAGRGAASTGYAHPKVAQAIADQAAKIIHAQINVYRHDKLAPLAAKLADITPKGIDTFYFGSTSDEIIEAAVKLAKHATDRRNVVVFDGAFHGRTTTRSPCRRAVRSTEPATARFQAACSWRRSPTRTPPTKRPK